jgi:hypothetical protein
MSFYFIFLSTQKEIKKLYATVSIDYQKKLREERLAEYNPSAIRRNECVEASSVRTGVALDYDT